MCSTVDQVGSRILHQGYGVSPNMRSVHAGLLANDCLIALDEAHCSEPFRQTLEWIAKYRVLGHSPIRTPFAFITMTATPRGGGEVFRLNGEDDRDQFLRKRLNARKHLVLSRASKANEGGVAVKCIEHARECAKEKGKTVLIVVNRVATARMIAEELAATVPETVLLTGRSRPLERDVLLEAVKGRLYAGRDRKRNADQPSLFVVATQCIEVGADLDADALISEACPLDSLRQRLGRLDRLGELGDSEAVLVAPREIAESTEASPYDDPIYGYATAKTWQWLAKKDSEGKMDAGTRGLDRLLEDLPTPDLTAMQTPSADAPVVFPAYCDLWVQTNPEPSILPEPALFLHGVQCGIPEVQIVWRADFPSGKPETWNEIASACPPVMGEALRIPIHQARAWLAETEKGQESGSDLEGEIDRDPEERGEGKGVRTPFLLWKGDRTTAPEADVRNIHPGDTVMLPASTGGCDSWGWAPGRRDAVSDLWEMARWKSGKTGILRIHPDCMAGWPAPLCSLPMEQSDEEPPGIEGKIREALAAVEQTALPDGMRKDVLECLSSKAGFRVEPHPSGRGWIVTCRQESAMIIGGISTEDDAASRSSVQVPLNKHLGDVESRVQSFGESLDLPSELRMDLALAASLHDLGKADPRFQSLLWGGDRIAALRSETLAKSSRMATSRIPLRTAMEKSGYPRGGRHELLSLRLAEGGESALSEAHDRDLVLHLIGSHHGRCRPFAPVVHDTAPRVVTAAWRNSILKASSDGVLDGMPIAHIGSGVAERFWTLIRRYGWWGLSYLEACFRLADHRASELEGTEGGA